MLIQGGIGLEHQLRHPRLRPLPLLDQVQAAAEAGQRRCVLSEKGQFAAGASELLGGFDKLCAGLRDQNMAALVRAYLDGASGAPGLKLGDRRRYLSLAEIEELVSGAPALVNRLEGQRALIRGLVLKCERCRHADWYSPRDTDPVFRCSRCGLEQRPAQEHWLGDPEPRWRYRLDEVLFQFLRHRGDLPALVVFERFPDAAASDQALTEVEVIDPGGAKCEIDFVVVDRGQLWIGEAFSDARYEEPGKQEHERLTRLADVAALLNARGVILATAADGIAGPTERRARALFPGPWPSLELRDRAFLVERPEQLIDAP
jgi:hypothetical protein